MVQHVRNTAPSPTDGSPLLTHQPINLHLPNPLSNTYRYHNTGLPPTISLVKHCYCLRLSCRPLPFSLPLPLCLGPFNPTPLPCISLLSFQLSTLAPYSPLYSCPSPILPMTLSPDGCYYNPLITSFPINLFRELYHYSLLPIATPAS